LDLDTNLRATVAFAYCVTQSKDKKSTQSNARGATIECPHPLRNRIARMSAGQIRLKGKKNLCAVVFARKELSVGFTAIKKSFAARSTARENGH
jgi:hypothetical protein